ncbi:two-component system sensor histidine kinase NtrB [Limibacillus halophilus]|uniref:histidine kinase n=1 Tax=Limibacillus halophilus TaxID=1579333 RepID=A0A839SSZ2_9PROT|nr:ATP-binding protein [Limibacillus halophilus]MBB3065921.1 two-component system nitrogen regulation sensor histidine kinase GlnL [Limibacillus halophilus]
MRYNSTKFGHSCPTAEIRCSVNRFRRSNFMAAAIASDAMDSVPLDIAAVLNALPEPVFVLDAQDRFLYVNLACEQFFRSSSATLIDRPLGDFLQEDSTVFSLIMQARSSHSSVSEYGLTIETQRIGSHFVSIDASAIAETPGQVVVSIQERSIARKIDHQLSHRNAARSVSAMGAMLAHEIKNPLSGIKGAAQLLEGVVENPGDRELTNLICEEADRIVSLVGHMESFSDDRPIERGSVNIHEVLEHVRRIAQSGFGRNVRFFEIYDPSLPPVLGNRDLLIQALLNLVKNAAEAVPDQGGEIHIGTRFLQGVRLAVRGGGDRVDLPLMVSVRDNGGGIPEDIQLRLFDPFVTTKTSGKGLGLALVAKVVDSHGGVIEFDSEPGRTEFRIMLPLALMRNKRS